MKSRLDLTVRDLGATQLKNIAELVRVYALEVGRTTRVASRREPIWTPDCERRPKLHRRIEADRYQFAHQRRGSRSRCRGRCRSGT